MRDLESEKRVAACVLALWKTVGDSEERHTDVWIAALSEVAGRFARLALADDPEAQARAMQDEAIRQYRERDDD